MIAKAAASSAAARGAADARALCGDDDRPIVVATNFGVGSRAGLEQALEVARGRARDVIALHVLQPPARTAPLRAFERRHAERRKHSAARMEQWLEPVAERARVMVWIEPGDPERVLVDTTIGASCLILGACGRIGVAARVVERARCPVHVVFHSV